MIGRDRQVLALLGRLNTRLATLHRGIAETTNLFMHSLDDGMLPAGGLRQLAAHFDEFAPEFRNLAAELRATADANEIDAPASQSGSPAGRAVRGIQERPGMGPEENSGRADCPSCHTRPLPHITSTVGEGLSAPWVESDTTLSGSPMWTTNEGDGRS